MVSKEQLDSLDGRMIHDALLQQEEDRGIRCLTCCHRCVIREGGTGICDTRANIDGTIKTLVYGNISSLSSNPVEKKPFFHFAPGTTAFTVGSWGCNASCEFCQNYSISRASPISKSSRYLSPEGFIDAAQREGAEGISISFNEAPTLMLEWNLKAFEIAHERGLYNTIVTNGYMTLQALDALIDAGLDAANVDMKGCGPAVKKICGITTEPVWENIIHLKERGVHTEVTTLVVPGLSDDEECLESIAARIKEDAGKETPWHLSKYYPAYKYDEPPTQLSTLLAARDIGRDIGLEYVYIGNVREPGLEDTICPSCGQICYERRGYLSKNTGTDQFGKCDSCGHDLGIKFWPLEER